MKITKRRKGFTLIELLVVIAIIAVLSVVVILSLNPAELLRQARDSNRISDLATLKSGLSLYLTDVSSTSLTAGNTTCYVSITTSTYYAQAASSSNTASSVSTCVQFATASGAPTAASASTGRKVDSTGWIPVHFDYISSGAPFGQLPVDPSNTAGTSATARGYFYSYLGNNASSTFKLASKMESTKFANGGQGDVEQYDGGTDLYIFEQGSNLAL